jgi:four helix bundle protein
MDKEKMNYDLEERLISFAVNILNLAEQLPNTKTGNYIGGQIIRSGTAPALIYGEAQSAESRKDFIHKMKIALKELRETFIALKIIKRKPLVKNFEKVDNLLKECNELISIFVSSIKKAQGNLK